jgi:TetR/AcrR family transcriptional regulator, transcriptional repressor for nem operon
MARPRTFDDDETRAAILRQFWRHGFEGTALPDLEEATGLSRKSLYNAFGDKQSMFVSSLVSFRSTVVPFNIQPLRADGAGIDAIGQVLIGLAELGATPIGRLGCMICNTSREDVATLPDIKTQVDGHFLTIEGAMLGAIRNAQARREIVERDPTDLARLGLGALVSISLLAKANQPSQVLKSIARETIAAMR